MQDNVVGWVAFVAAMVFGVLVAMWLWHVMVTGWRTARRRGMEYVRDQMLGSDDPTATLERLHGELDMGMAFDPSAFEDGMAWELQEAVSLGVEEYLDTVRNVVAR